MAWTTTELLATARRRGRIPDDDPDYTDANLLLIADDALLELFVPFVVSVRSDYYQRDEAQALVAQQSAYVIPSRAVGSVLREVIWVDSAGRTFSLPPVTLADRHMYALTYGRPICYAVQDDTVLLLPAPNASSIGTLRICYEYRPGKLVAPSACGLLATTAPTATVCTVSATPAGIIANTNVDFIKAEPPFPLLGTGTVASVTGTTIVFAAGVIPSRLALGDYVAVRGQSPIPQIPAEMHSVLGLAVATDVLGQVSPAEAQDNEAKLGAAFEAARKLIQPRSKGRQIKVVNRTSAIRRGRRHRSFMGDFTG